MSRCDSAAIVANTNELFPEPDTPVKTQSSLVDLQIHVLEVVFAGALHPDAVVAIGDVRRRRFGAVGIDTHTGLPSDGRQPPSAWRIS